jgi:hypothetical protein
MSKTFSVKLEWTDTGYILLENVLVYSERYDKYISAAEGEVFDGATGAIDLNPLCFIPHDVLCRDACFSDGTPCTNHQASMVYFDQMRKYGYSRIRSSIRYVATFLFGGNDIKKKNGWF